MGGKFLDQAGSYVCPVFSPDGKHCFQREGRSITVWDLRAARTVLEFPGDDSFVYLAISADGTRIISGDENGDFRTWDVRMVSGHNDSTIEETQGRNFSCGVLIVEEVLRRYLT